MSMLIGGGDDGPRDLASLLEAHPEQFGAIVKDPGAFRLQILLAEIVEDGDGRPVLHRSALGDLEQYFYPASTIKLCAAIAAPIELNRIN
ncbi:MAG: hypothetical protein ACYTGC_16120, partial [Planctomycetota bacterium]